MAEDEVDMDIHSHHILNAETALDATSQVGLTAPPRIQSA